MLFSSKKTCGLVSPCNGSAIPLAEVPDEAFASGMLGKGFAVHPSDGRIVSPVSGRIVSVASGRHAYTILSKERLDVLVHIGVDTVTLDGAPFSSAVADGDAVRAGDLLATVDLSKIRERGLCEDVIVLVTDADRLEAIEYKYGASRCGKDLPMCFRIRRN